MDKITEALSKLLPESEMKEVSAAVAEMLEAAKEEAKQKLEAEYNKNLEEAYAELSSELTEAEKIGEEGYKQAWAIISELRNRIESLRTEYDAALEEGYEEAFQNVLAERGKNETLERDLHEEYEKRFKESTEHVLSQVDAFLKTKGKEIYEMARRDIMNDPAMVEHRVVLDKIVESVSDYITDEDRVLATSSKLETAHKSLKETSDRVRMLEAKNIRLATENNKLNEQVRQAAEIINENKKVALNENKKARVEQAKNAVGRGKVTTGKTEVIAEYAATSKPTVEEEVDNSFAESFDEETLRSMQLLAGTRDDN